MRVPLGGIVECNKRQYSDKGTASRVAGPAVHIHGVAECYSYVSDTGKYYSLFLKVFETRRLPSNLDFQTSTIKDYVRELLLLFDASNRTELVGMLSATDADQIAAGHQLLPTQARRAPGDFGTREELPYFARQK